MTPEYHSTSGTKKQMKLLEISGLLLETFDRIAHFYCFSGSFFFLSVTLPFYDIWLSICFTFTVIVGHRTQQTRRAASCGLDKVSGHAQTSVCWFFQVTLWFVWCHTSVLSQTNCRVLLWVSPQLSTTFMLSSCHCLCSLSLSLSLSLFSFFLSFQARFINNNNNITEKKRFIGVIDRTGRQPITWSVVVVLMRRVTLVVGSPLWSP